MKLSSIYKTKLGIVITNLFFLFLFWNIFEHNLVHAGTLIVLLGIINFFICVKKWHGNEKYALYYSILISIPFGIITIYYLYEELTFIFYLFLVNFANLHESKICSIITSTAVILAIFLTILVLHSIGILVGIALKKAKDILTYD